MKKTQIDWCDYTINPVKGLCPVACSYCYARRLYKRFKWNPELRYKDVFWYPGIGGKPGDRYFVGSTMELFGDFIENWWLENIFMWVEAYPQRTFIFLTKQPQNLRKWSPFPENCWVGVTATNTKMAEGALFWLQNVQANVKFISFEPLLEKIRLVHFDVLNWLIIGQQTPVSAKTQPKIEWLREIVEAADEVGIPVFLKNNLASLVIPTAFLEAPNLYSNLMEKAPHLTGNLRQEFPE